VVLQHVSCRAASIGFACAEDDAPGAEHRNKESAATLSPYRTTRYGAVTAFLASSSVHSDLLAHSLRVPNAIQIFTKYRRPAGSRQGKPLFKINEVSMQSEFSNDRIENSMLFQNSCRTDVILDPSILRRRSAACELVHIHSIVSLQICRLGTFRKRRASLTKSTWGRADIAIACAEVRMDPS
jgi:hypothetical protein